MGVGVCTHDFVLTAVVDGGVVVGWGEFDGMASERWPTLTLVYIDIGVMAGFIEMKPGVGVNLYRSNELYSIQSILQLIFIGYNTASFNST